MRLYLLRHGEPQPEEKDPQRRLTPRGRLDIATIGRFLEQNGLYIPEIWHSDKARVRETADIIAQAVGTTRLLEKSGLAPLDPVGPIRGDIINRKEDVMLVGIYLFSPFWPIFFWEFRLKQRYFASRLERLPVWREMERGTGGYSSRYIPVCWNNLATQLI